jgi:hypothetical protein
VAARYLRFEIFATEGAEPCIDELEILATDGTNLARDAVVTSSGDYPGNAFHLLQHVNDGRYGNEFSWISNQSGRGWLVFDLGKSFEIDRVLWSRDRTPEPKYADRVATQYAISASMDGIDWTIVADDTDRLAKGTQASEPSERLAGLSAAQADRYRSLRERQLTLEKNLKLATDAPRVYAGRMEMPEPVFRFHRGDPTMPKEAIQPGGLEALAGFELPPDAKEFERRIALANWIASPTNPLTARVMVNRLWHYHFGCGIVDTPSDLGAGGGLPSHPELLDWLAVQFIESGWSMKHIQRLICNAQVYRRSSRGQGGGASIDTSNRLLSRFPARRIEAEPLRDTILAVSGKLDRQRGGPGFDLFEPNENYVRVFETKTKYGDAEFRRMVYQRKPRVELDQLFGVFDCPDAGQIQPRRNVSTTPLQALNLLNSQFMLDQSAYFAERLRRDAGDGGEAQIQRAFWLAFSRPASAKELSLSLPFLQEHGLEAFCRAVYNSNEFIMVY